MKKRKYDICELAEMLNEQVHKVSHDGRDHGYDQCISAILLTLLRVIDTFHFFCYVLGGAAVGLLFLIALKL